MGRAGRRTAAGRHGAGDGLVALQPGDDIAGTAQLLPSLQRAHARLHHCRLFQKDVLSAVLGERRRRPDDHPIDMRRHRGQSELAAVSRPIRLSRFLSVRKGGVWGEGDEYDPG